MQSAKRRENSVDMKQIHRKIQLALKHLSKIPKQDIGDLEQLIVTAMDALDTAWEITRDLSKED